MPPHKFISNSKEVIADIALKIERKVLKISRTHLAFRGV